MTASCERVRANLAWFVGGDLDAATGEAVRLHLIECVACRNEAAGLQQAVGALGASRRTELGGVDDAMFAAMHSEILARVDAHEVEAAAGGRIAAVAGGGRARGLGLACAAMALVGAGFWWGQQQGADSVWERPPVATSAGLEVPKAVPWSGPRAPLRLLGNDGDEGPDVGPDATGLRGREELRSLVDEGLVLPRPRRPR